MRSSASPPPVKMRRGDNHMPRPFGMARSHRTLKQFMVQSLVVIFLIPSLLLWISFFYSSTNTIRNNAINEQMTVTTSINLSVETMFLEIETLMNTMSADNTVLDILRGDDLNGRNSKLYNAYDTMNKLVNKLMVTPEKPDNVILLNSQGNSYSYSVTSEAFEAYLGSDEFQQRILSNKGRAVILTGFQNGEEKDIIILAKPIMDINKLELVGSICVAYPVRIFDRMARQHNTYSDNIAIVDNNCNLLFTRDSMEAGREIIGSNRELLMAGGYGEINNSGDRQLFVSSSANSYGVRTINFVSISQMNRELLLNQLFILCVAVTATVLVAFLVFYVYKKLYSSIRKLGAEAGPEDGANVEYYELKQVNDRMLSLISKKNQGEDTIVTLIDRCETVTLDKLQAQINPHFLYNTLSSIKNIAILNEQKEISSLITALVKLLRSTVNRDGRYITLENELENIKSYMVIQNVIYENNIDFAIEMQPGMAQLLIPNFILQPLLENCIFHGIHPETAGGVIRVNGYVDGDTIVLEIIDNGDGFGETFIQNLFAGGSGQGDKQGFTNLGIRGVQDKIHLLCGEGYGLSVASDRGTGSKVSIHLPRKEATES